MAQILEPDEIKQITGKMRWSAQIRVLAAMGIDVTPRPDGSPLVNVLHFNQVTGATSQHDKQQTVKLDLSA